MNIIHWLLVLAIIASVWVVGVAINRLRVRRHNATGDPASGVIVFVEPVRWLFIIWGFAGFSRGLRRGGCNHRVRLFRWGSVAGALLVIPDLVRRDRLTRKAERLAKFIDRLATEHPGAPIHVVGYSSGCFVTLEACRQMRCHDRLGHILLLAGAVSPRYQWDHLTGRVRRVYSFHSPLDWISGLGPLLFGSNDRQWGLGCGTVGFQQAPAFLQQRSWRPHDARLGYLGDHFTIASPRFVARHIAPIVAGDRREP